MKRSEAQAELDTILAAYALSRDFQQRSEYYPEVLADLAKMAANWVTIIAALPVDEGTATASVKDNVVKMPDPLLALSMQIFEMGRDGSYSWRRDVQPIVNKYRNLSEGHRGPG